MDLLGSALRKVTGVYVNDLGVGSKTDFVFGVTHESNDSQGRYDNRLQLKHLIRPPTIASQWHYSSVSLEGAKTITPCVFSQAGEVRCIGLTLTFDDGRTEVLGEWRLDKAGASSSITRGLWFSIVKGSSTEIVSDVSVSKIDCNPRMVIEERRHVIHACDGDTLAWWFKPNASRLRKKKRH